MHDLTEKIIGALALGVAGVIGTIFLIVNHYLKTRFIKDNVKEDSPIQSIGLIGNWHGQGLTYALKGHLHRSQAVFEGQFEWTFQEFATDYEHARWAKKKIGRSGIEMVRGVLTGKTLKLCGYKLIDQDELGLILSDYLLEIDEPASSFAGTGTTQTTKEIGKLTGNVAVQR
jgi:hypothetical protein